MRIFTIRPAHNPIGPFDFAGGYDDRSDRRQRLAELMNRGYEDAYHQFIEPVVGASGEQVSKVKSMCEVRVRSRNPKAETDRLRSEFVADSHEDCMKGPATELIHAGEVAIAATPCR